jgi:hypothetical protein
MDPQYLDPELSKELGDIPWPEEPSSPSPPSGLADYIAYLRDGGSQWPRGLLVPGELFAGFNELFKQAESVGLEHGYALMCDRRTRQFGRGDTVQGNWNSINPFQMPEIQNRDCFGYVHAHPSKSIGHKGGYSPHSIQDLLLFEEFSKWPHAFEFVVSGPRLYVMVCIHGVSIWNADVKKYLGDRLGAVEYKAKQLLYSAAGGQAAWESGVDELPPENDAMEKYRRSVMARMPDFGKRMEDISMSECLSFAKKFNYGFISWSSD